MNIAFKEVNQDGELILNDKHGDDVEITESGIVDCTEIKINKTVLTSGRVLQNVTLGALPHYLLIKLQSMEIQFRMHLRLILI